MILLLLLVCLSAQHISAAPPPPPFQGYCPDELFKEYDEAAPRGYFIRLRRLIQRHAATVTSIPGHGREYTVAVIMQVRLTQDDLTNFAVLSPGPDYNRYPAFYFTVIAWQANVAPGGEAPSAGSPAGEGDAPASATALVYGAATGKCNEEVPDRSCLMGGSLIQTVLINSVNREDGPVAWQLFVAWTPTLERLLSSNANFKAVLGSAIEGVPDEVAPPASPMLPPGAITACVTEAMPVFNPETQRPFDLAVAATCIYRTITDLIRLHLQTMNGAEPRGVWIGYPALVATEGNLFKIGFPRVPENELLNRLPPVPTPDGSIVVHGVPVLSIVIIGPSVPC